MKDHDLRSSHSSRRRFAPLHLVGLTLVIALAFVGPALFSGVIVTGPDVVVFDLYDTEMWGSANNLTAYSVGTESCNRGTEPVLWIAENNQHPVIAQNLYRLKDGRLEQLGISWLKHGFLSVNGNACATCTPPPMGSDQLGVGCSDPYSASLNGNQNRLGPRHQVNAYTGDFAFPYATPAGNNTLRGRIQVNTEDVEPASNPGAQYFIEGQYVTADDAGAGNSLNNVSYRPVSVTGGLELSFQGDTFESVPAIHAWHVADPSVSIVNVDVPAEGRFVVASTSIDNGDTTWSYEYAIFNLNSHRSAQSFSVPIPTDVVITNTRFHDVEYHSGEPYDGTDWTVTIDTIGGSVSWTTDDFGTDEDANALRWGTMYNFSFVADAPPQPVTANIGLFRPGSPSFVEFQTTSPGGFLSIFSDGFESGDTTAWSTTVP